MERVLEYVMSDKVALSQSIYSQMQPFGTANIMRIYMKIYSFMSVDDKAVLIDALHAKTADGTFPP